MGDEDGEEMDVGRFSGRGSVVYAVGRQLALQLATNMTLSISVSL